MGFFTETVEKKTQLFLHDNRKFEFIKRPLKHACLVEEQDGKFKRAWKHFFNAEIPFYGYKNISADSVTLSYARDIILDPFNKIREGLGENEKPKHNKVEIKEYIAQIATNMRHIYSTRRQVKTAGDALFWIICGIDILMIIGWAIKFFTK